MPPRTGADIISEAHTVAKWLEKEAFSRDTGMGAQRYRPDSPQGRTSSQLLLSYTARAHFALCSCCILGAPFSWKMSFPQGAGSCGKAGEEKGGSTRLNPSGLVLH